EAAGRSTTGRQARPPLISPSRGIPCQRSIGVRGTRCAGQLLSRKNAREATEREVRKQTHCEHSRPFAKLLRATARDRRGRLRNEAKYALCYKTLRFYFASTKW